MRACTLCAVESIKRRTLLKLNATNINNNQMTMEKFMISADTFCSCSSWLFGQCQRLCMCVVFSARHKMYSSRFIFTHRLHFKLWVLWLCFSLFPFDITLLRIVLSFIWMRSSLHRLSSLLSNWEPVLLLNACYFYCCSRLMPQTAIVSYSNWSKLVATIHKRANAREVFLLLT